MTAVPWRLWEGQVVDGCLPLRQYLGGVEKSAVFLTQIGDPEPRNAAIKLVLAPAQDAELLSQWERAAQLSHPHLLRVLRIGSCRVNQIALHYLVTEYAEENLAAVLADRPLSATEMREMLGPLLDALAYVHGEGLVHGHLKPANILAVEDQLKLSVDGISRVGDLGTAPSPPGRYDPPEFGDRGCSPVGDVWSFGVTLVEALTQQLPVLGGPKEKPALPGTLPAEFLPLVRACLRPDPRRRGTLRDIVAQFRNPGPEPEEPPAAIPPAAHRKWLSLAMVGTATLLLAALLAGPRLIHQSAPAGAAPTAVVPVDLKPAARQPDVPPVAGAAEPGHPSPAPAAAAPAEPEHPSAASLAAAPALPREVPKRHEEAKPGQVVRQVMPDVTAQARSTIRGRVTINVRASVDSTGHVTKTRLESGNSRYFANLALRAVEQWAFEPVKVDGQEVASEWLLRFEITSQRTDAYPSRVSP